MKQFIEKFIKTNTQENEPYLTNKELISRQIKVVYELLAHIYGSDKLVLKASKLDALQLMRSEKPEERVLALQRLIFEDPTLADLPKEEEIPEILDKIKDEIADILARRTVEEDIEKKITEKMQQRHEEYVREVKMQVLKETAGPENAQTLKKLALLEKLERSKLATSAIDVLRPQKFADIVGQERAIRALVSKLASPFPQHIIIYGPPGVGKTTAARLALETAKKIAGSPFSREGKFVEVDGSTLRWDPREITNPLLGSVHDPIYQGARRDLADTGIPEPKPGLVTEAHGGILFIDEIGELDPILQNKLLKVLEDKRVYFESSYYDPDDPNIPKYIKKLFEEGAPADFILIGATTREPEYINPAIRSRCAEVYFEPLAPGDIEKIVRRAAEKLKVNLEDKGAQIISQYTTEGRKATNILCDAYAMACYRHRKQKKDEIIVTENDIYEVIQTGRLVPNVTQKASSELEVGRVFGLGVMGFLGSVLEIEAVSFPAHKEGMGSIRFNDTAGSMAKDSVFNAASVIRKLTGEDISNYDVHINIVGGGRIDGPSAGAAITMVLLSAVQNRPVRQDIAITGEISIQGRVRAVGGITEKIYGARQAGIKKVLIPKENAQDVPADLKGITVIPVSKVEEMLPHVFSGESSSLVS
ncbi:ATP-dependent Lon protease [Desulfohalotomaculum tongense]|uniref:Lon family ATP-dependent protease n=1 Tax=Desulforadius tongensis TaxID=1216062 RepID=UPI00195DDD7A|nr:ATP-dependent Lon protease [Desulforadius tongensis]